MVRRVLLITLWFPTDRDPVQGVFVEAQARALSREFDVAVIAPDLRGLKELRAHGPAPTLVVDEREGIPVFRPRAVALVPRSVHWGQAGHSYSSAVKRAFRELATTWGRPDIIHAHVLFPAGWAAVKIGHDSRIPVVVTEHASLVAMPLRSQFERRCVRTTIESADRVLAVGERLRSRLLALSPGADIRVVGNLVDTDFFAPSELVDPKPPAAGWRANGGTRLLTIGVAPDKGVDILFDALGRLGDVPVEVAVGGAGRDQGRLVAIASRLPRSIRVEFLGRLDRQEVRRWLGWCDIYVQASRHETFGITVAEAMASGKGVVVTRSGGPEQFVIQGTGLVVEPADPSALARALQKVIAGEVVFDGALARRIVVDRFGPEAFVRQLRKVYDEVVLESAGG